ncbi:CCA tRNA nucleotidyltransferase [Siphonobacter sp. BAB-5385]|uniref:CCA tRNA nucleotidyltransferase n=2 Tax=unclassified Siphonobacter TaxID=2635712 RepID=UPI0020CF6639|nr:HD domain-containing protein [Siphonobacter sp. BAB-5385]
MTEHLKNHPVFPIIARSAAELNVPAYVIGGYVRDLLLNRPSKDIDIVCVGSGIALAEQVAKNAGREHVSLAVYKNFGTAQVKFDGWEVEFVGARKESYRSDSRKPVVEDGTLEDDQNRRDFTINALALSLNPNDFGTLIDPFDGQADLRRKIIRTPLDPAITFSDDPLRMLRAIRFATQLNFDIDPDTFTGLEQTAPRIEIISQERITDELNKILRTPTPSYGFKLLEIAGLLNLIFPDFVALKGAEQIDGKGHKDNFYHTLQVLDNVCRTSDDLWVRWAAVLHDIAKPATKRFHPKIGWTFHGHEEMGARMVPTIFRKFRLPLGEEMRKVQKLVRLHLRPIALAKDGITDSALRRVMVEAGDDLDDLMRLCRADITSKDGNRVKRYLANFDKVEALMKEVEERDQLRQFQPIITGEMIMDVFGLGPSKEVGQLKNTIREAILEGTLPNDWAHAYPFMLEAGAALGFQPVKELTPPAPRKDQES